MDRKNQFRIWASLVVLISFTLPVGVTRSQEGRRQGRQFLKAGNVKGDPIVRIGYRDGRLTAALQASSGWSNRGMLR